MVLSLTRILSLFGASRGASPRALPSLDLKGLSDRDLADLNLPPNLRARAGLQRSREHGMGRW